MEPLGRAALIASVGGQRGWADWANPRHRLRRLLAEFIGMAGLTFILSGGAAVLARYGGGNLRPWDTVLVLSLVSALWLVVAVYFLGDISAHFNPATTLAFALRRDMGWPMAGAYWVVQFAAAAGGSLLARAFFGAAGNLAATMPKPGLSWQVAGFEAVITFGLVLMVLSMANGPKLNGPFIPLAVGSYILAWGTMGGPFDGASMNPARSSDLTSRSATCRRGGCTCSAPSSVLSPPWAWRKCCAARPGSQKRARPSACRLTATPSPDSIRWPGSRRRGSRSTRPSSTCPRDDVLPAAFPAVRRSAPTPRSSGQAEPRPGACPGP